MPNSPCRIPTSFLYPKPFAWTRFESPSVQTQSNHPLHFGTMEDFSGYMPKPLEEDWITLNVVPLSVGSVVRSIECHWVQDARFTLDGFEDWVQRFLLCFYGQPQGYCILGTLVMGCAWMCLMLSTLKD
jgi:hypothetical protein